MRDRAADAAVGATETNVGAAEGAVGADIAGGATEATVATAEAGGRAAEAAVGAAEAAVGAAEPSRPAEGTAASALVGARVRAVELAALAAIVVVAVAARFVDLATRGAWDADQGHDMLVLRALVTDGVVPLLGPPTSIGAFHHGVLYYYLLAPAAALSGADPLGVVAAIALAGVAAVVVTWWLGRSIGGPIAGVVAALLMAVSSAAIEESTFIWNPNLIALSSAISFAAAWHAWTTGRARWWVVAAAAQVVTMHCHVLGSALIVPLAALLIADWRRRPGDPARRRISAAAAAGVALIALSYVPLAMSELQTGFAESRAAAAFLAGGGPPAAQSFPVRLVIVAVRVLSWPLAGLVTAAPIAAVLAAVAVLSILAWRAVTASPAERFASRWFAGTLAWSIAALTLGASTLATVVPGLPNDHYHAFLDPIVFVTVGLGGAAAWRGGAPIARAATAAGVAAVVVFNVLAWPPRVAPDGGYPLAEVAARRVIDRLRDRPYVLVGLPRIKSADAYGFPLTRLGRAPTAPSDMPEVAVVIACDRLFEETIGAACGGPAEDAAVASVAQGVTRTLIDRFDASARTSISIYGPAAANP